MPRRVGGVRAPMVRQFLGALLLVVIPAVPCLAGGVQPFGRRSLSENDPAAEPILEATTLPADKDRLGIRASVEVPPRGGRSTAATVALPAAETPSAHAVEADRRDSVPDSSAGPATLHSEANRRSTVLASTASSADKGPADLAPPTPGGAAFIDRAPLWAARDPKLQRDLEREISRLGLRRATAERHLGVALVDVTNLEQPRVAAINGDEMVYAASLPKIAVLLAAFEKIATGRLELDSENRELLNKMIRISSNTAATTMMNKVGKPYIAYVMTSPKYRLYDESHGGGLWAGKNYASDSGLWQRDPMKNLSHAATPMQVARFYYMLATGKLVNSQYNEEIKAILGRPGISHKFVKGIAVIDRSSRMYRKSGTWGEWHADSALIERAGVRYIAVGLCQSPDGGLWLEKLIRRMDGLVIARNHDAIEARTLLSKRGVFGFDSAGSLMANFFDFATP